MTIAVRKKTPANLSAGTPASRLPYLALLAFAALLSLVGLPALAQDEPFIVHDTKPVIMQGPYISSLSETGATIVWLTDTPCHAKVVYGLTGEPLTNESDNAEHGLLPVGTLHAIHLSGLTPGRAYTYKAVATRVVKMKAYWPEKGLPIESPEKSFTTFDRAKPSVSFTAIADTHEDNARVADLLKGVDWPAADFFVHLGDAFHGLESEDQLSAAGSGPPPRLRTAPSPSCSSAATTRREALSPAGSSTISRPLRAGSITSATMALST